MRREQRAQHRRPSRARRHHLDPDLAAPGDLAGLADGRVGIGRSAEGAGAIGEERTAGVVADHPCPGLAHRVEQAIDGVGCGANVTTLSCGSPSCGPQRPQPGQAQRLAQRVADTGRRNVGVGVRDVERDARRVSSRCTTRPLAVVAATDVVPPRNNGWCVTSRSTPAGNRLVDDDLDRVDGEQHPSHVGVRVAADQADGVPRLGPGRVVVTLELADDLG